MPISAANKIHCEKYASALEPLVDHAAELSPEQLVVASAAVISWIERTKWLSTQGGPESNMTGAPERLRVALE